MSSKPHAQTIGTQQLRAERVKLLFQLFGAGQASLLSIVAITAVALWNEVPHVKLVVWLALVVALSLVRATVYFGYQRARPLPNEAARWEYYFAAGASMMGLLWAAFIVLFFPPSTIEHQLLILLVITGVPVGAIGVLSPSTLAYFGYFIPAMVMLMLKFSMLGSQADATLAALVLVYGVTLLFIFRTLHNNLLENLKIKFHNQNLLQSLGVMHRIEEINQELEMELGERKRTEDRMRHLAYHDTLTGLPNRGALQEHLHLMLNQAHQEQRRVGVLFLDVDRFKNVNDTLGHISGDTVLKVCAERLVRCVRHEDIVARTGGDEFVVVLSQVHDMNDVARVAQQIIDSLSAEISLGTQQLRTSSSVGISLYPDDGVEAETLLKNADTAMYAAKSTQPGSYRFFSARQE